MTAERFEEPDIDTRDPAGSTTPLIELVAGPGRAPGLAERIALSVGGVVDVTGPMCTDVVAVGVDPPLTALSCCGCAVHPATAVTSTSRIGAPDRLTARHYTAGPGDDDQLGTSEMIAALYVAAP
jgi:hypothetical protein